MYPLHSDKLAAQRRQALLDEAEKVRMIDDMRIANWQANGKLPFWHAVLGLPLLADNSPRSWTEQISQRNPAYCCHHCLRARCSARRSLASGYGLLPVVIVAATSMLLVIAPLTARVLRLLSKRIAVGASLMTPVR